MTKKKIAYTIIVIMILILSICAFYAYKTVSNPEFSKIVSDWFFNIITKMMGVK